MKTHTINDVEYVVAAFTVFRLQQSMLHGPCCNSMLQEAGFNACREEGPAPQHTVSAAVQNGLDDEEVRAIRDRVPKVNSLNYLDVVLI